MSITQPEDISYDNFDVDDRETKLKLLMKDIEKSFKCKDIIRPITEDLIRPVVSTTPSLDIGLNKGIPQGSLAIFSGAPKCGKTTLALKVAVECQKLGMMIFYGDVEGRLKVMNLQGSKGLDLSPLKFQMIGSRPGNILSAEQNLEIFERILRTFERCLLIIDSTSSLCSSSEQEGEYKATGRNSGPKLLAQFCRRISNVIPVNNNIVICVQHLIANTSGFGSPFMEDGGNKINFQQDIKIRAKAIEKIKDKNDNYIGQKTKWEIVNSALGPPRKEIYTAIRYGYGIDEEREIFDILRDVGLVNASGSWYVFSSLADTPKLQGEEKCIDFLRENPSVKAELLIQIRDIFGLADDTKTVETAGGEDKE